MCSKELKICVAQLGARRHYIVPEILYSHAMLEMLYTDLYTGKFPLNVLQMMPRCILPSPINRFAGRSSRLPDSYVRAFQSFGLEYIWKCKSAKTIYESTRVNLEFGIRFGEKIVREGFRRANAVYAYRSAAAEIFETAKKDGCLCFLDQTICPKSIEFEILQKEYEKAKGWEDHKYDDLVKQFSGREKYEWELADLILCGSDFVRDGVVRCGGDLNKCRVIPTGINGTLFLHCHRKDHREGPLRVLFVGQVNLRKGIRYLLQALSHFSRSEVDCRLVGQVKVDAEVLRNNTPSNTKVLGIVPRQEIFEQYVWADVFCLPSLCEGSALVTYEALAAGLPVITTFNSGSIVRDGLEGVIVPIMDSEAIAIAIEKFLKSPELLRKMSSEAYSRAKYGSIDAYSRRLVGALKMACLAS